MIEPIAGGPLPTMGRSSNGNGGNDGTASAKGATTAPAGVAAASAELLESLPPLLAYGVTGQLLTNGNRHTMRNAQKNAAGQKARKDTAPDDEHIDREA